MARVGKIARLPSRIRNELNQRLLNNEPASEMLPWVNGLQETQQILLAQFGKAEINAQNLSEWRQGGYVDWLAKRDRVARIKELQEFSYKLAEAAGDSISAGSTALVGAKILELLETAADEDLAKITGSLVDLRHTEIATTRLKIEQRKLDQKDRQLALEEKKFQRTTAELFIKWFEDQKAKEIVEGKGTDGVKMDALVKLMFGERPSGL